MKKSIIAAGAASVALAAMPVVGVFAVNGSFSGGPFTDKIQTTIADTCTFARGTIAEPTATHGTPSKWTTSGSTDTLTAVAITPAAAEATLETSTFNVICNDLDGYQVAVDAADLTTSKATVHAWSYYKGSTESLPTTSYWRLSSNTTDTVDIANDIVSKKTAATDGTNFTITYYAYAQTGQDSGSYSADVVYTATQLD